MEDFVTFEIAKKLKEKGFPQVEKNALAMYNEVGEWFSLAKTIDKDEYSFEDFDDRDCVCPTISQALKWLRKEKELHIEFIANASGYCYIISRTPQIGGSDLYCGFDCGTNDSGVWDDYEEAALHAIEYILDNLI
jgi:hypothetical protein